MSAFKYQNKTERQKRSHFTRSPKGKFHLSRNTRIDYIGKGRVMNNITILTSQKTKK